MIKLVPRFTGAQIKAELLRRMQIIENAILLRLKRTGEAFVTNARLNGTYTDRTGNLRSSVGYVVLKNGEQLASAFPGQTLEGKRNAKAVIESIKPNYPQGFVLICVAGMDYAAAVESKGRDVITASSITAENDLKRSMQELKGKLENL